MSERRKAIRLATINYRGRRIYFVTLCCAKRHHAFLDERAAHDALDQLMASAAHHDLLLHAYCLMPDHLHNERSRRFSGRIFRPACVNSRGSHPLT